MGDNLRENGFVLDLCEMDFFFCDSMEQTHQNTEEVTLVKSETLPIRQTK